MDEIPRMIAVKVRDFAYIILLVALSFHRLLWFQNNRMLAGGDLLPSLDPIQYLTSLLYMWDETNLGTLRVTTPRLFAPIHLFEALGQVTGLGLVVGQKLFVVTLYSMASVSIFYTFPLLFQRSNWRRPAFLAAIAYVYSPYLIADAIQTSVRFLAQYAIVPLSLLLFLRGIRYRDLKYSIPLSVLSLFIFSDFPSVHTFFHVAIILLAVAVYEGIRGSARFVARFGVVTIGLSLLVNLWWLAPFLRNLDAYTTTLASVSLVPATQTYATLTEVLRFLGKWSFYSSAKGISYIPYAAAYENPIIIVLSYAPIALAFGALLIRPREPGVLFLSLLAAIGLFLAKGVNPPAGLVYETLLVSIPLFRIFRESWYFMQIAVVPASLLIGITSDRIISSLSTAIPATNRLAMRSLRVVTRISIPALLIVLIVAPSWPLLTNSVSENPYVLGSKGVEIPDDYPKLLEWFREQRDAMNDFKVLLLPKRGNYAAYTWGYVGGNILYRSLPNLVLGAADYISSADTTWALTLAYESFYSRSHAFPRILSLLGIKFIILEGDFDTDFYDLPSLELHRSILRSIEGIAFETNFGDTEIYRNTLFSSKILVPTNVLTVPTLEEPEGVMWYDDNFASGWITEQWNDEQLNVKADGGTVSMSLLAEGEYVASSIVRRLTQPLDSARYLVVRYRTSASASMAIEILNGNGSFYLTPVNPASSGGQSQSVQWRTEAFELPALETNTTAIRIFITNYYSRNYIGSLELWIDYAKLVTLVGTVQDVIYLLETENSGSPISFVRKGDSLYFNSSRSYNQGETHLLSAVRNQATSYDLALSASRPFILVLSEAYSTKWTARIGGQVVKEHFKINGFANAWIIDGSGALDVTLNFEAQTELLYGSVGSLVTFPIVLLVFAVKNRKFKVRQIVSGANLAAEPADRGVKSFAGGAPIAYRKGDTSTQALAEEMDQPCA